MPSLAASPVNVASVPQRSPLRYPGGKTWLVPQARAWLAANPRPARLVEAFAGGASVGLAAACEDLTDAVTLVELDDRVAALWSTITAGDVEELAVRIETFDFTEPNVRAVLDTTPTNDADTAFVTIVANRAQRGGILAPGAGLMRAGENGRGLASRWYPTTLARRLRDIAEYRHRLDTLHADAFEVLTATAGDPDVAWFIDPPYTASTKRAGARLYTHHDLDHEALFELCEAHAACGAAVLLTYDNDPAVISLAQSHGFDHHPVAMRSTHHARLTELIISTDVTWVR